MQTIAPSAEGGDWIEVVRGEQVADASTTMTTSADDKRASVEGSRSRRRWLAGLFWVMFGAGVLVQVFAPRLKIEHNAFVIPPSLVSAGKQVDPAELIARERRMQMLSAALTGGGAIGLGIYYRRAFFKGSST